MTGDSHLSTHPPLPPTTEDDRVAWVRLLRSSRIGPATFFKLLSEQGSAQAALAHLPERAKEAGLTEYTPCPAAVARAELKRGHAAGARPVFHGSAEYPSALNDLPDPPPMLWIKGDAALLSRPTLSLIGARTASSLGLRMARRLAQDLGAAGFTIVFGLARGIDAAAHEGALPTGTVAILPGGIDQPYPAQNADLMAQIAATGLPGISSRMGRSAWLARRRIGSTGDTRRRAARRGARLSGIESAIPRMPATARSTP